MAKSTIGKANLEVATEGSGHAAPGPPAVSGINPPTSPAGMPFTPAPFLYVAKTSRLIRSTASGGTRIDGNRFCLVGTCMDIDDPANKPGKPLEMVPPNGADLLTKVSCGLAKITGKGAGGPVVIGSREAVTTGAETILNVPVLAKNQPGTTIHQSKSALLGAADLLLAWEGKIANPAVVIASGDPVAPGLGEVIDSATDIWLPGLVELSFERHYASSRRDAQTPLGRGGWTHSYHQWIRFEDDEAILSDASGRPVKLGRLERDRPTTVRSKGLVAQRSAYGVTLLERDTLSTRVFSAVDGKPKNEYFLTAVRDRYGNQVALQYEDGELSHLVDTAGRQLRLELDGDRRIVKAAVYAGDALVFEVLYGYGPEGELSRVENGLGEAETYGYDAKHRLLAKTTRAGVRFDYRYDPESGRCIRSTGPNRLHNVELQYEGDGVVTEHGNPVPRERTFDGEGNLRVSRFFAPLETDLDYDDDGLVTSLRDAAGGERVLDYDEDGRLVRRAGPGAHERLYEYAGEYLVKVVDNPGEETFRYDYDHRGGLSAITRPDGLSIHYERDRYGRVSRVSSIDGVIATYTYDEMHNVASYTDARGATTKLQYDAMGRVTVEIDPIGRRAEHRYDALGRPVWSRLKDGTTLERTFDRYDNVVVSSDGATSVRSEFGGTGSLLTRSYQDELTWTFRRDRLERIREIENPKGELYELSYDRTGRIAEERTFDGSEYRYRYDLAGKLARVDYEDETWLEVDYDDGRRVVEERSPHGDILLERDERGRVIKATVDERGGPIVIEQEWGVGGRLLASVQNGRKVSYQYDDAGRVVERELPDGSKTRYAYDEAGALIAVTHGDQRVRLVRDGMGREVRRHFYELGLDAHFRYQADDRVAACFVLTGGQPDPAVQRTIGEEQSGITVIERRYAYGAHARIAEVVDGRRGMTSYEHDSLGRLVGVRSARSNERYRYDVAGSLVQVGESGAPWSMKTGNVLVKAGRAHYENDVRRRRKARIFQVGEETTETRYVWDCRDQLREVVQPDGSRVVFQYDAFGRRTRKIVIDPITEPTEAPRTRTVDYVWDDKELAMEIDSEHGTRVFVHDRGTHMPMLQHEGGETFAVFFDHRGVPTELVGAGGEVVWSAEHTAWGGVTGEQAPREIRCPFGLLGHYIDRETRLSYARHRYFDPATARWLSPDPLGIMGGANLHGFDGSPTEQVDPMGLMTRSEFIQFMKMYRRQRIDAQAASDAAQSAHGGAWWVTTSADAEGNVGQSGRTRRADADLDPDDPRAARTERYLHSEEEIIEPGAGRPIGAGRRHCANCVRVIMETGNLPATTMHPNSDLDPFTNPDGGAGW